MRDFKGMKRQRGRNRKPSNQGNSTNPNRSWDSQGPENIKVRGNAQTVYERYQQLARDATSSGDRVLAENYLQHAEHYFRVLRALQPQRSFQEIAQREQIGQGFDIDFEDESGAQAAAFLAAQQAADRQAQQGQGQGQGQPQPGQNGQNGQNGQPGEAEARDGENGRRESRRERWERRRDGRRTAYERDESEGGAERSDESGVERPAAVPEQPVEPEQPRRRTRAPAAGNQDEAAPDNALPGFLTRPTPSPSAAPAETAPAEAAPADESGDEKPAARRRAPRRKAADAPMGEDV